MIQLKSVAAASPLPTIIRRPALFEPLQKHLLAEPSNHLASHHKQRKRGPAAKQALFHTWRTFCPGIIISTTPAGANQVHMITGADKKGV
jgi:hypothetical protein